MNSPGLKIYRLPNWGVQSSLAAAPLGSDVPTLTQQFGGAGGPLTGPGGKIPDALTAMWIGPNSEADSVWVQGGGAQGQQPFLVSVGHPWIGRLDKDILLWQNTPAMGGPTPLTHLLELVYVPIIQGMTQNYPPPSIPQRRAPLRKTERVSVAIDSNTDSAQIPVFGRRIVSVHIDNSGGAEDLTVTLKAGIAIDTYATTQTLYVSDFELAPATVTVAAGKQSLIQVVNAGAALTGPTSAPWAAADWVRVNIASTVTAKNPWIGWVALD